MATSPTPRTEELKVIMAEGDCQDYPGFDRSIDGEFYGNGKLSSSMEWVESREREEPNNDL